MLIDQLAAGDAFIRYSTLHRRSIRVTNAHLRFLLVMAPYSITRQNASTLSKLHSVMIDFIRLFHSCFHISLIARLVSIPHSPILIRIVRLTFISDRLHLRFSVGIFWLNLMNFQFKSRQFSF